MVTAVDIFALVIVGAFVLIGLWRGFVRSSLKLCALIASIIIARFFGAALGRALLPEIIKSNSISSGTLEKINTSISSVIGTLAVFAVLYLLLSLLARLISKITVKGFAGKLTDKVLGALLGLFFGIAALYSLAFVFDIISAVVSLVAPSADMYSVVENSVIFKYFF